MSRPAQHAVLLLLGGALVRIASGEVFLRYVRPGQRWLLVGAGVVVVALAAAGYVRDLRGSRTAHDHDHGTGVTPWLLVAPVLVMALFAPPALGADAVVRAGPANTVAAGALMAPLPPGDGVALTVGEFVQRANWDTGRSLEGRDVELTGFAVRRGPDVELARLTISCCAADARASRVRLGGDLGAAAGAAPDTWLRVRGTVVAGSGTPAAHYVPAMTVRDVAVVPAPDDPYEY